MKRKIYFALCFLFGAVFIASAIGVFVTLRRYQQADEVYEDLRDRFVMANDQKPGSAPAQTSRPGPGVTQTEQATVSRPNGESAPVPGTDPGASAPITEPEVTVPEPPPTTEQAPIRINFDALLQESGDAVGWLYCEGTKIHYPVMQSHDNEDYLHADIYGNYLYSGTLFVDYRCGTVGTDQNLIIYGHTMKNGTMFGTLRNYKKQSYYDEHPVLYYLTPGQDYRIDLFAGFVTKSTSKFYSPNFKSADEFAGNLKEMIKKSTFKSDVTVTENDRIVMLSSCDYEFNDARYVLFGKLTPLYMP